MNIDHVEEAQLPTEPIFVAIFKRQHELEVKYRDIEKRNGFYYPPEPTPHIDDAQLQHWIKGMFWRVHEEVAEALETIPDLEGDWKSRWDKDADLRHFWEELSDALHFLTAVSLVMGILPQDVQVRWGKMQAMKQTNKFFLQPVEEAEYPDDLVVTYYAGKFVFALGLAANTLKNKPWKVTQMPTDPCRFAQLLIDAWDRFFYFLQELRCNEEDVWNLYHKKNCVNKFRQDTAY